MGTGAGGTRNISGTNHPLVELERELADLHGKEAALVFTSGCVSNETGISTIAELLPDCLILSDALNHNSMIEGVRRSGCEKQMFRHNDVAHLEELLRAAGRAAEAHRVREPLFDGRRHRADRGDLRSRREIQRHDLYRRGPRGRHVRPARRRRRRARRRDGSASTSSRARWPRPSAASAAISRRARTIIDAVRSYAPGFIFTTALPPAICAAATCAAIRHLKTSQWERERQQRAVAARQIGADQPPACR